MLLTILTGLMATANAEKFQPKYELSGELGYLSQNDDDWSYFGNPEGTYGVRLGYHLNPKLSVVTSVHSIKTNSYENNYYYDEYEEQSDLSSVKMNIRSSQLSVGPKYALELKRWFVPYATTQGLITHSTITMGDDLDRDEAKTYLRDSSMGIGAIGALGLEMRTKPINGKFQLNSYFELGAGVSSEMKFAAKDSDSAFQIDSDDGSKVPLGDLQFAGQYLRFGIGTRF
jgi:hypothetical protein